MTVLQKYYWNQYQYQLKLTTRLRTARRFSQNKKEEGKMRQISNEELFNLSEDWENATVDTTKYYSNVMSAVEVSDKEYEAFKKKGCIVQEHDKKYFVALSL